MNLYMVVSKEARNPCCPTQLHLLHSSAVSPLLPTPMVSAWEVNKYLCLDNNKKKRKAGWAAMALTVVA